MDDNFVWCALIFALAYVFGKTFPEYMERLSGRDRSRLESMNDAVDDMEQTVLAIGKANEKMQRRLEVLESDVGGHQTRLGGMGETVEHSCWRLATLEEQMRKAKTSAPANEARHD